VNPPILLAPDRHRPRAAEAAAVALGLIAARIVDPNRPLPFDVCLFKRLTGIPCPTCGLTRALCHALRGDWGVSFDYHPAGILLAAGLIGWMLWSAADAARGRRFAEAARGRLCTSMIGAGIVVSIAAWVVRLTG
jgi:Protein of unknown function (DUF2752)